MKKVILILIIFFLLFGQNICNAKDAILNGEDWRLFGTVGNGKLIKVIYVRGQMEGGALIVMNIERLITDMKTIPPVKLPKLTEFAFELINKRLEQWKIFNIPYEQIVDGLDVLYEDYKNRNIIIPHAVHIVKKQIKGASEEEINAILEYLRGGMEDKSKLKYKDKTGKLQEAEFP